MNDATRSAAVTTGEWASRFNRYAKVDLSRITVRRAVSNEDFELVGRLRQAGFSRVSEHDGGEWVDASDQAPGVFSLIAFNSLHAPVATMRVQDGRFSDLELSRFVPLDVLLSPDQFPAVQGARLSVAKAPEATDGMFALFKSVWQWCQREQINSILCASPPWAKPVYDFLMFEDLGPEGHFEHVFLDKIRHVSMRMPVERPISLWRTLGHPLYEQYNEIVHSRLCWID